MKILVVCSYKEQLSQHIAPFVKEQVEALQALGLECDYFLVTGKGLTGYLKQLKPLKRKISEFQPDVIHAHFGLSGLLANLQRQIPVVTTYHGSDINDPKAFRFSKLAMRLSAWNVFVSRHTLEKAGLTQKASLIPCGVNLTELQQTTRAEARQRMKLSEDARYVLFSGAFDNPVKNAPLAKEAVGSLDNQSVELLELKGFSREEVTLLMCAADALLMTSITEGSPQVIKEAMACGCPIVSVDVGDVKERTEGVEGCYTAQSREPQELATLLQKALAFQGKTSGFAKLMADGLDNGQIAEKLKYLYQQVIRTRS